MTIAGMPNIRVVIREAEDEDLTLEIPNLTVKVEKNSDYNVNVTPSVVVAIRTGSYNRFADVALLAYTASYFDGSATSASFAISGSYALTSSYAHTINRQISGSVSITGSTTITDNLNVEGIISAEKLLVSSSIIYESGSTKFGDSPEDTHQFTGSVLVQGPISASGGITGSFKGDGSQLTGLVTDLRMSGSTGSDTLSLLTDDLIFSGANGITTVVTNNKLTIDVPIGLTASLYGTASVADGIHIVSAGIYLTSSDSYIIPTPSGGLSYITSASYALTASYAANGGGGGASDWNSITGKPSGLVSSSTQVIAALPAGTVSSSIQINTGSFTGSFTGSLNGTITSASFATTASAATSITFTPTTASYSITSSFATSSSRATTSSFAITASYALNSSTVPSGTVSSSTQIIASLPAGTVSSSTQINTGSFSGSFTGSLSGTITSASYALTASYAQNATATVPAGTVSSSTQVIAALPAGTVSSSGQVDVRNTTGIATIATTGSNTFSGNQTITGSLLVSNGTVSASELITNSSSLYLTSGSNLYVQNNGIAEVTGSLIVSGNFVLPTGAPTSPQTGSMYFSGSFIYVYTGTQYRSASLV